ncbi:MAG TPA: hypothetical protein VIK91_18155 [Nannocystis sp.]
MEKLKLIAVVAFLVICVPLVIYAVLWGNGAVTVKAPADRPLKVFVDGQEKASLSPGESARVNIEQGTHELWLEAGGKREVHTLSIESGTFDRMIPLADQCFVLLDVTNVLFEREKLVQALLPDVAVKGRFRAEPFSMPAGAKFSLAEFSTEGERRLSELLAEVPCDALEKDDAALIALADLQKPEG